MISAIVYVIRPLKFLYKMPININKSSVLLTAAKHISCQNIRHLRR